MLEKISVKMKITNIIFVFILLTCSFAQDCKLKYKTDFPEKESVLLWKNLTAYDLIEPANDGIILKRNKEIAIACPGAKNLITKVHSNFVKAKCIGGQTFKIENNNFLLSDLGCDCPVTGEILSSGKVCGTGGIIKHIGYSIERNFNIVLDTCYYDANSGTFYADHFIYGSALPYSKGLSFRPTFKIDGIALDMRSNIANAYVQTTQKETFTNLLGRQLPEKYIRANSYLARGHLAPDADMIYTTSKLSTYFYLNTVPQWQQINNGNWKSVEISVRNVAKKLKENFLVYTGSYEVLALPNIHGVPTKIYLSNGKLPVPKFVWKVIYTVQTNKGIAFVSVNNPFIQKLTAEYNICTNICNQYNWGTESWTIPEKGLVYCCQVSDLRKIIPGIPAHKVDEILKG